MLCSFYIYPLHDFFCENTGFYNQHFWDHPDMWAKNGASRRGFVHIAYDSNSAHGRMNDKRVSYYNPKYPWIEAMHEFTNCGSRAREWDAARFTMPARRGSGLEVKLGDERLEADEMFTCVKLGEVFLKLFLLDVTECIGKPDDLVPKGVLSPERST